MLNYYVRVMNISGLGINIIGVAVLYRFAVPYRAGNDVSGALITTADRDPKEIKTDRLYNIAGITGLTFVMIGTFLQFVAAWLSPDH